MKYKFISFFITCNNQCLNNGPLRWNSKFLTSTKPTTSSLWYNFIKNYAISLRICWSSWRDTFWSLDFPDFPYSWSHLYIVWLATPYSLTRSETGYPVSCNWTIVSLNSLVYFWLIWTSPLVRYYSTKTCP